VRPRGWYSYRWGVGHRLPPAWYGPAYYVDYGVYGLAPPPYGYRWVRVDNDVLLVAIATGIIADILSDFYYY
jgi:Ni/Co efflux regulator RcnB